MRWILVVAVFLASAANLFAQDSGEVDETALPAALSRVDAGLAKRLQRDADDVVEDAMTLVLGYGADGAIDRAGIERSIAVERARQRAIVLRRLIEADLDADGSVTGDEIAVIAAAAEARFRGRVMMTHRAVDGNGDGTVSGDEARDWAQAFAMDRMSEADAARALSLMGLDLDADGRLTVTELLEVSRIMQSAG
jgi:EF hand